MAADSTKGATALIVLTLLAVIPQLLSMPSALKALLVAPIVFWVPGYALLRAAFRDDCCALEMAVLATGLSIAICVLCGVLLNIFGAMTPVGWSLSLQLISVASIAAMHIGGRGASWRLPPITFSNIRLLVVASLLVGAAIAVSRINASAQREFAFTELWMLPSEGDTGSFTVGVANHERDGAVYDLEIRIDDRLAAQRSGIDLDVGNTWTDEIVVPRNRDAAARQRVEVVLFKDGNYERVYRRVWASSAMDAKRRSKRDAEREASSGNHEATLTASAGKS